MTDLILKRQKVSLLQIYLQKLFRIDRPEHRKLHKRFVFRFNSKFL